MKRALITTLSLSVVALLVAGCANPLGGNVFQGAGAPEPPSSPEDVRNVIAQEGVDALMDELDELSQSEEFYQELAEADQLQNEDNPEGESVLDTIRTELAEVYNADPDAADAPSVEQRQRAALTAADIELNTSEGSEVVDSLVTVAFGFLEDMEGDGGDEPGDDTGGEEMDFETVITDVINTAFGDMEDADFEQTLSNMQNAADAYEAFGNTLETVPDPVTGEEKAVAPPEVNIEAVTQNAVVAIAVSEITTAAEANGTPINTKEDLIDLANSASEGDETSKAIITDALEQLDTKTGAKNILEASGFADLLMGSGTEDTQGDTV